MNLYLQGAGKYMPYFLKGVGAKPNKIGLQGGLEGPYISPHFHRLGPHIREEVAPCRMHNDCKPENF